MIKKWKHFTKEIFSFVIIVIILANIVSFYRSTSLNKEQLPLKNITLDEKPILIHFWATWCPTCKLEAANIQKISEKYRVITIAVQSGDDTKIQKYLDENSLDFFVINDFDGSYSKKFNISVFPTTLIYNKNRNLLFSEVGYTSTLGLYLRMWWAS